MSINKHKIITKFRKGHIPWNKGKKGVQKSWNKGLTKETDSRVNNISLSLTGKKLSKEHRLNCSRGQRGKKNSDESNKKRSEMMKRQWKNPEYREKLVKSMNTPENKAKCAAPHIGRVQSIEETKKRSQSLKKRVVAKGGWGYKFKKGHIMSKETKEKMSKSHQGICIPHTEKTKNKIRKTTRENAKYGSENHSYKDGNSPLKKRVRKSWRFRVWREAVFQRDDYTCQQCKKRGFELHPHHQKRFADIWDEHKITTYKEAMDCIELWDIQNGVTLCVVCHRRLHKR